MQREIKFRVFDKEAKTMLRVSNIYLDDEFIIAISNKEYVERIFSQIELMQFTGLYDKHGKEIYEGDIVKHRDFTFLDYPIHYVAGGEIAVKYNELAYIDDVIGVVAFD
ncbi:YopX family protein, partial [Capnocytophaga canis]|uniref:YopX family protein n=1 Tax=Capnocytophaga canis TaxID=1848903 RepID=UPI0037D69091